MFQATEKRAITIANEDGSADRDGLPHHFLNDQQTVSENLKVHVQQNCGFSGN